MFSDAKQLSDLSREIMTDFHATMNEVVEKLPGGPTNEANWEIISRLNAFGQAYYEASFRLQQIERCLGAHRDATEFYLQMRKEAKEVVS